MSRGVTLIELLVGIATAVIIAAVSAKVLQLGIMTYNYAARQNAAMVRTRKALSGDGARTGVLESSRAAYAVSGVSASTAALLSGAAVSTSFYVANTNLYRVRAAVSGVQADQISSLQLNYYMSTNGMISSTTVAASATMLTAMVTVGTGTATTANKTYTLYSGAQLRNHP